MTSMMRDWWAAHRLEVFLDLVFFGLAAVAFGGFLLWKIFRKSNDPSKGAK